MKIKHWLTRRGTEFNEEENLNKRRLWLLMAGIFLVSAGMLALEIAFTRILSVVLSYHYVFAVISLALLGLGLGAIFNRLLHKWLTRAGKFGSLTLLTSLLALSVPVSILLMARLSGSEALGNATLLYLVIITAPFFFSGIFFAEIFRTFARFSSRLYGMDLLGAAAGVVGVIIALNVFGGVRAVMVIGSVVLVAAGIFTLGVIGTHLRRTLVVTISLLLILSMAGLGLINTGLADISIGPRNKEMSSYLAGSATGAGIAETKWNAYGRTDLVAREDNPGEMVIFTDGTAGTPMYRFNGDIDNPDPAIQSLQTTFSGYLALSGMPAEEKTSALIIGPGGGRDVLVAQMAGIQNITAVEVNRDTVDLVRQYSQYNGGIYDAENVTVVVEEGRNFLKRQNEKYDIIMLSIPVTNTSRSLEGYALTENFLFTTDSIKDYLEHLTDNGRLVIVAHNTIEILKLMSLSFETLGKSGLDIQTSMQHIAVIGSHHLPTFILKKTPFKTEETVPIHSALHELGYDPGISFLPAITLAANVSHAAETGFEKCSSFNSLFAAASQGLVNPGGLIREAVHNSINIKPVTDDSPFFYRFTTGLPGSVTLVFWVSLLSLAAVSSIFYIRQNKRTAPGKTRKGRADLPTSPIRFIILFSMLGIGFMLVEISIFQRLTLFLGQPVLSLAVMLAALLLGAGLGSLYSGRFSAEKTPRVLVRVSLITTVILLAYAFALPALLSQLLGLELNMRLLAAVLVLLPLGFFMGFPFPLGMRLLKAMDLENSIPWIWGINGAGSVVGSTLTIIIAISLGFTTALILGAVCYLVVLLTFYRTGVAVRERGRNSETGHRVQEAGGRE